MLKPTLLSLALLAASFTPTTLALDAAGWRKQSIYQLMTDRFARTDGSTTAACNLPANKYCGGTYQGIIKHLDYIQGMGFTAIWISPVVENTSTGYHGYYQLNQRKFNLNFGTQADLVALANALHARGMYLMIDVVANHMGVPDDGTVSGFASGNAIYGQGSSFSPSSIYGATVYQNKASYHSYCDINYDDQNSVQNCWLDPNLPDLNQAAAGVQAELYSWITWLVSTVKADGLRIDTVKHVDKTFWPGFEKAAGVFSTGEVFDGDPNYLAPYQSQALSSVLNYGVFYPLRRAFLNTGADATELGTMLKTMQSTMKDVTLLPTFLDNHDNARFASTTSDVSLRKNALAFSLVTDGIPLMYSGGEQGYSGGADPYCREPIWSSGYSTTSDMYKFVKAVLKARMTKFNKVPAKITATTQVLYNTKQDLVTFRGGMLAAFTNRGAGSGTVTIKITIAGTGGTWVDAISGRRFPIASGGVATLSLVNGLPLVLFPLGAGYTTFG